MRHKAKHLLAYLLPVALLLCMVLPQGESQSVGGRIGPTGWIFLCKASISAAATSIGPCTLPTPPANQQWRLLMVRDYVSGYGGGGDTAGYRFNGDTGANYRSECLTTPAGSTVAALGTNNAVSATVMKLAPSDSNSTRNFTVFINNSSEKTEKTAEILSLTGTGSAATQAATDLCNGAWVSAASTSITSITSVTLTNNMGANSGFAVFGIAW